MPLSHQGRPTEFTVSIKNVQKLEISKSFAKNMLHDSWKPSHTTSRLPRWCSGKESPCQCRRHRRCRFNPWVGKISWRTNGNTLVFLPGKSNGKRQAIVYGVTEELGIPR